MKKIRVLRNFGSLESANQCSEETRPDEKDRHLNSIWARSPPTAWSVEPTTPTQIFFDSFRKITG